MFFQRFSIALPQSERGALPRTIDVRTGLGAGSLNKRFGRMGTSRHCLQGYFLYHRGIAYILVRFLHYRVGRSLYLSDSVRTCFFLEFVHRISADTICIQDLITDHIAKDLLCTSILHTYQVCQNTSGRRNMDRQIIHYSFTLKSCFLSRFFRSGFFGRFFRSVFFRPKAST